MRYRYHHVLKSKWLDGKRNWHIDHLISTLVTELLPDIEHRLKRQVVLKPDKELSAQRRRQILARAPEIPRDHITQVEDMCFQVQSSAKKPFTMLTWSMIIALFFFFFLKPICIPGYRH